MPLKNSYRIATHVQKKIRHFQLVIIINENAYLYLYYICAEFHFYYRNFSVFHNSNVGPVLLFGITCLAYIVHQ